MSRIIKNATKILSVIIATVMIVSCAAFTYAVDEKNVPVYPVSQNTVVFWASDAVLDNSTQKVTLTVNCANNPGMWGYDFVIFYPTCLTIDTKDNITVGEGAVGSKGNYIATIDGTSRIQQTGYVLKCHPEFEKTYGTFGVDYYSHVLTRGMDSGFIDCTNNGMIETITFTYHHELNYGKMKTLPIVVLGGGEGVPGKITENKSCAFHGTPYYSELNGYDSKDVVVEYLNGSVTIPCLHEKETGEITTPATCYAEGVRTLTCPDCGFVRTSPVEKTAHIYSENYTVDKVPTLTEDGIASRHCINCTETADAKTLMNLTDGERGDVTGDGEVTTADLLAIRRYIAGITEDAIIEAYYHDFNGSGELDMGDILFLRQYIAGIRNEL